MRHTFSIVSHGQGHLVANLLGDFLDLEVESINIILTLNIPEDESFLERFSQLPIKVIRNEVPKGFGHNHNDAFALCNADIFVIVNPDIRFIARKLLPLLNASLPLDWAACAPVVTTPAGEIEASARSFPTITTPIKRLFGQPHISQINIAQDAPIFQPIDWVAGMFVCFRTQAYADIKGFDTGFFLYYEDVDICLRLKQKGYQVYVNLQASVQHDAQRQSHKSVKYLRWHFASLIRYFVKHFQYLLMRSPKNS
jgi:N-acetylglucosaminyl-diphospho-decaprenol L-rhamnosyltransferase